MTDLLSALASIVGENNLLHSDAVAQRATHFWNAEPLQALALVRPANTQEVSEVLKACHAAKQSVVTHGGVTGLVDGERSTKKDIVLSLERMREIESIDSTGQTITVQAGCVLEAVQAAASDAGLQYGLDLGARGSCTIGGNISTNAGGLSVLRYGMTREQVLGLEAVLADGTVVSSMNAMMKNNAGYDLKQLFIGSEGTLGVVTKAVLRLRAATPYANTAILAFQSFEQLSGTLQHVAKGFNGQLNAFEVIWNAFYRLSTNPDIETSARAPLADNYPIYVIVESKGCNQDGDKAQFERVLMEAMELGLITDAVIAQSEHERKGIWHIRENVDLTIHHNPSYSYDVSLPIAAMDNYVHQVELKLKDKWPNVAFYSYGHLADGNLHLTVAPLPEQFSKKRNNKNHALHHTNEGQEDWHSICNHIIYSPLTALGGSVSAEHGIGLLKKAYLSVSRNENEIALMQLLKQSLDPHGILNPGKII